MNDQYFKVFFEKAPTAHSYHRVLLDDQGLPYDFEFLKVNKAYEQIMGLKAYEVIGKRYSEVFLQGQNAMKAHKACQDVVLHHKLVHFDMKHPTIQKWLRVAAFSIGENIMATIINDVTKEYLQDKEIEGFLKVNLDMLCVADTDGKLHKVNKKFEHVLGYTVDELEGTSFMNLVHEEDVSSTLDAIKDLEEQKTISGFINRYRCKDGSYKYLEWHSQPNGKYVYASIRDITEKKQMEMKLNQTNQELMKLTEKLQKKTEDLETISNTDKLTGLYNRHYLDKRINKKMENADNNNHPLSMIIMDLDDFKCINDKWGHPIGDVVLKHTAKITSSIIGKSNILVRIGGEEFLVIMPHSTINDGLAVAEKIRKTLENTEYPIAGKVTASFGVAERLQFESFCSWYKRVDEALYQAKESGRNRVVCSDRLESFPMSLEYFEWKSEWESGFKEIDEQHHQLLEIANYLIDLTVSDVDNEKIMDQLDTLLHYIIEHFNYEEQVLQSIGYPDYFGHAEIHNKLVAKALQLKELYQNGKQKLAAVFSFLIDEVIMGHMLESDTQFIKYTRNEERMEEYN